MAQQVFEWGAKTYVMGILNLTPDSFSDGGQFNDPERAVHRARKMVDEGADMIDVGAESTRPGSASLSARVELDRLFPALPRICEAVDVPVSVDTYKRSVAEQALEAGAAWINDVWGLQRDRAIAEVAASHGAGVILMHNQQDARYRDLMEDIANDLRRARDLALEAGVPEDKVILDPGFGFAKTVEHNLALVRRLSELQSLGQPLLLGPSRKSTIGHVLDQPVDERVEGTGALVSLAIAQGVDIVRVHDVKAMKRTAVMSDAVVRAQTANRTPNRTGGMERVQEQKPLDRIDLHGMTFHARHGVWPEERELGQVFKVDVTLWLDLNAAARSDRLQKTVDYSQVYQRIAENVTGRRRILLETLASDVASELLNRFDRVEGVQVVIHKPHAPLPGVIDDVSIRVKRGSTP